MVMGDGTGEGCYGNSVENHLPVELRDFACVQFLVCGSRLTIEVGAAVDSERMAKILLRRPMVYKNPLSNHRGTNHVYHQVRES